MRSSDWIDEWYRPGVTIPTQRDGTAASVLYACRRCWAAVLDDPWTPQDALAEHKNWHLAQESAFRAS